MKLCCCSSKRNTHGNVDICQIDYSILSKLRIFSIFWSHKWKYSIQVSKRLTNVTGKWSTIQFEVFVLYFIFLIPMYQKICVMNRSHTCYFLHISECCSKQVQLHASNEQNWSWFELLTFLTKSKQTGISMKLQDLVLISTHNTSFFSNRVWALKVLSSIAGRMFDRKLLTQKKICR